MIQNYNTFEVKVTKLRLYCNIALCTICLYEFMVGHSDWQVFILQVRIYEDPNDDDTKKNRRAYWKSTYLLLSVGNLSSYIIAELQHFTGTSHKTHYKWRMQ